MSEPKHTRVAVHRLITGERRGVGAACARAGLRVLSAPYWAATRARNALYDAGVLRATHVDVPVISVGNITAGGTGKTPLVLWIAGQLMSAGRKPVILSRGYGSSNERPSDEMLIYRENLPDVPHVVGADRVASAAEAINEHGAQCLVLDDGFQHRRIARDLDIVTVDCLRPFGHGRLLPRGLLREPLRGLGRADLIVLTRADACTEERLAEITERIDAIKPGIPFCQTRHAPVALENVHDGAAQPLGWLRGKRLLAFSSVGNPEAYADTLRRLGGELAVVRTFPDHHWYEPLDVRRLREEAASADAVVTTEKDAVKLRDAWGADVPLWMLKVRIEFLNGEDAITSAVDALFNKA